MRLFPIAARQILGLFADEWRQSGDDETVSQGLGQNLRH